MEFCLFFLANLSQVGSFGGDQARDLAPGAEASSQMLRHDCSE